RHEGVSVDRVIDERSNRHRGKTAQLVEVFPSAEPWYVACHPRLNRQSNSKAAIRFIKIASADSIFTLPMPQKIARLNLHPFVVMFHPASPGGDNLHPLHSPTKMSSSRMPAMRLMVMADAR